MGLMTKYAIQAFNPVITPVSNSSAALLGSLNSLTKDAINDPLDSRIKRLKMSAEVMREINGIQDGIRANKRLAADIAYRQGILKNARDRLAFDMKKYNDKLKEQGQSSVLGKVLADIATAKTEDNPDVIAKETEPIIFKKTGQDDSNLYNPSNNQVGPLGDLQKMISISDGSDDNAQEPTNNDSTTEDASVKSMVKDIIQRKTEGLKGIQHRQTESLKSMLQRRGIHPKKEEDKLNGMIEKILNQNNKDNNKSDNNSNNDEVDNNNENKNKNENNNKKVELPNIEPQDIGLATDIKIAENIIKPEEKLIDNNIALEKVKNLMKDDLSNYIDEYKKLSGGQYPTAKELTAISKMVDNKWKNRLKYILSLYDQADAIKKAEAKENNDIEDLIKKIKIFKAKKDYEYRLKKDFEEEKLKLKKLFEENK